MAAAVQSGESGSGTAASKDSCSGKRGGCSDSEAPVAPRKQDSLMPEIQEDTQQDTSSSSCSKRQADQLADDIRHSLSTSKQHILQARPSDGSGSVDSDRK